MGCGGGGSQGGREGGCAGGKGGRAVRGLRRGGGQDVRQGVVSGVGGLTCKAALSCPVSSPLT